MVAFLAVLCVAYACSNEPTEPLLERFEAPVPTAVSVALVSSFVETGTSGVRVALAVEAQTKDAIPLEVVQVRIRWDQEHLRWLGQAGDASAAWPATRTVVNRDLADDGELRLVSVNPTGLEERFADLAFEVLSASWRDGLRMNVEGIVDAEGVLREFQGAATPFPDPSLAPPTSWHKKSYLRAAVTAARPSRGGGPQRAPGESSLYGDATLEGVIDSLDVFYASNVAAGTYECIVGTDSPARDCLAVNVRPNNSPGLGGPSDLCPPGLDSCGGFSRTIDALDVFEVSNEASGTDQPVAGEPIPGNIVADTVFLSGVITGTREFASDSVYVLQSDLVVGDTATSGELIIGAGAEIRGASGAALIVSRNGRILAEGTVQSPIRMVCHGTAPDPGCWEGLVIAGSAPVNAGEAGLGLAPALPGRNPSGGGDQRTIAGVRYGGDNAADSSGVLKHVVLEDAGESGQGIALAGVGTGTVIEGLQSNRSGDVGISVLGGSVDASRLLVTGPTSDGLAFSLGYDGAVQYAAIQLDPDASDRAAVRVTNAPGAPTATPATQPEIWNLTVIGGTPFFREHTALEFEDAGGTIRNALLVQAAVGIEANAGACALFASSDLDVDHVVMLGTTETVVSDGCESGLLAALEAGEADGLNNARPYAGDLEDPFDGELLDIRPTVDLQASATAATPGSGLDPSGDYFGAAEPGDGIVPWYTGWSATWERPDGFASLPVPVGFTKVVDTLLLTDSAGFPIYRRAATLRLDTSATPTEVRDLFETFGLEIVGFQGTGNYYVTFPDPGTDFEDYAAILDSLGTHPAVDFAAPIGGKLVPLGRFPLDSVASARSDWDPASVTSVQNWKNIRAPQAWMCQATGSTPVAIVEPQFGSHPDLSAQVTTVAGYQPDPNATVQADLEFHGVAVAGQLAAIGDNGIGIAGMNWDADLDLIRMGSSVQDQLVTFATAVDSATARGARVLSLSVDIGLAQLPHPQVSQSLQAFLDADPRNIIVKASGQNPPIQETLYPPFIGAARSLVTRTLHALDQQGYGDRIILVGGSDNAQYAAASHVYRVNSGVPPKQISAPYTHAVLDAGTQGTLPNVTGTSFGTPMVAGLATLLYQMRPTLSGAEVIDLILDGAARPEVFGDTLRADTIIGLPSGAPTLHQLDAYGAMQELSERYPDSPICGLDVFISNDDVVILRDVPQSFQVTNATFTAAHDVDVAPGGRTLAVGTQGGGGFATRFFAVDGTHQADSVGTVRVQFVEEDTVYMRYPDSVRIGGSGTWTILTAPSGARGAVDDPLSIAVGPEGDRVIYMTRSQVRDTLETYLMQATNLGGSPVLTVLDQDFQTGTWSSTWRSIGTSWTEFGDEVLVSRFLEFPDETRFDRVDPLNGTVTPVVTISAEQSYARMIPFDRSFMNVSIRPGTSQCILQERSMGTGFMVDSLDVTSSVPDCDFQWPGSYTRGLAPPRVAVGGGQ